MKKIKTDNSRKIRGHAILSKGDEPQAIDNKTYFVPSQSEADKKYKVVMGDGNYHKWTCTCPDYQKGNLTANISVRSVFGYNSRRK